MVVPFAGDDNLGCNSISNSLNQVELRVVEVCEAAKVASLRITAVPALVKYPLPLLDAVDPH